MKIPAPGGPEGELNAAESFVTGSCMEFLPVILRYLQHRINVGGELPRTVSRSLLRYTIRNETGTEATAALIGQCTTSAMKVCGYRKRGSPQYSRSYEIRPEFEGWTAIPLLRPVPAPKDVEVKYVYRHLD